MREILPYLEQGHGAVCDVFRYKFQFARGYIKIARHAEQHDIINDGISNGDILRVDLSYAETRREWFN